MSRKGAFGADFKNISHFGAKAFDLRFLFYLIYDKMERVGEDKRQKYLDCKVGGI